MSATTDTITVIVIADCHGIESMIEKDTAEKTTVSGLFFRARANRQRHSIFYEAELTPKAKEAIDAQIKAQDFVAALVLLRATATELRSSADQVKSWELIPNPKLDPCG